MVPQSKMLTFESPVEEAHMGWDLDMSETAMGTFDCLQATIVGQLTHLRQVFGLEGHAGAWPQGHEALFKEKLKEDTEWVAATRALLRLLLPGLEVDLAELNNPNWANAQLKLANLRGEAGGKLQSRFAMDHSYVAQLQSSRLVPMATCLPSSSIGGIVISRDRQFPLGVRGGRTYEDTHMLVPAGYVDWLGGSRHPLVASWFGEQKDELGLEETETSSLQMVGVMGSNALESAGNVTPIFVANTGLSLQEIMARHETAQDKNEHKELHGIRVEDIISYLRSKRLYDPAQIDLQEPFRTSLPNRGTLLPHVTLSLLGIAERMGQSREAVQECLCALQRQQPFSLEFAGSEFDLDTRSFLA